AAVFAPNAGEGKAAGAPRSANHARSARELNGIVRLRLHIWLRGAQGAAARGVIARAIHSRRVVRQARTAGLSEVAVAARTQDRSFRSLSGLERTASTSRVLNLAAVATQNAGDVDYESSPFFKAASLNGAVIIKHRLRADEQHVFERAKRTSTKVIIPFERTDLSLGGRSLFVGQRGWQELLYQLRGTADDEARDVALLEALDELPSL